jgi:hypothetical protein
MRVASVSLVGANPGDFVKTGDGCSLSRIAPGGGCVINARFAPTDTGARTAALRIVSSAAGSPMDVALAGEGAAAPSSATAEGGTSTSEGGAGGASSSSSSGSTAGASTGPAPPDLAAATPVSPIAGLVGLRSTGVVGRSGAVRLATATNPPTASTTQAITGRVRTARARRVVLGRGRTAVPDGRAAAVVVRLNARGRRILRSRRTIRVTAEIVARGAGGETAPLKRRLRLWAAGAKRF